MVANQTQPGAIIQRIGHFLRARRGVLQRGLQEDLAAVKRHSAYGVCCWRRWCHHGAARNCRRDVPYDNARMDVSGMVALMAAASLAEQLEGMAAPDRGRAAH